MKQPNILFICTDQQRSDSLTCAGNAVARTPNIDSLARSGTRFTRHIAPCQICMPSRSSFFTGLYPRNHQVIANGYALDPKIPTLPGLLAEAGYRTHGSGKHHFQPLLAPAEKAMPESRAFWKSDVSKDWKGPFFGLQSIDLLMGEADTADIAGHYARWLAQEHPDAAALLHPEAAEQAPPEDLDEIWQSAMPVELHYNSWVTERALDFIEEATDPFFLFVSYPDPHHPFAPPKAYAERFDPAEMPLPRVDAGELDKMPSYYRTLFPTAGGFRERYWSALPEDEQGSMIATDDISEATMRLLIAYTYAMIEMIDDNVGRMLRALREKGVEEETIVIFTSDHGELLGTHGLLHKGPPPYRQLLEIPFVMKGPGILENSTCEALTNHVDLLPTLLELCGLSPQEAAFDGISLLPILQEGAAAVRAHNFGEYHPWAKPEVYNQTVQTQRWRYSHYPRESDWGELFDLEADPGEHRNLWQDPGYQEVVRELSAVLAREFPPQAEVATKPLARW
jgi:arylsulfatase A-like enzyme